MQNHAFHPFETHHEIVALFKDPERLQEAVAELEATAFPRDAISILGTRARIEEKFGVAAVAPEQVENDEHAPREALIRDEEKFIGAGALVGCATYIGAVSAALALGPASVPAVLMAIVLGGGSGAAMGSILLNRLRHKFHHDVEEQIAKGGLVLWVRTPDPEREALASDILKRYGAEHIIAHHDRLAAA